LKIIFSKKTCCILWFFTGGSG